MMKTTLCWSAVLGIALACAEPTRAAILVNDTWSDGSDAEPASPAYSENGVDSDSDGDLESVWFRGGNGTLNPAGAPFRLRGQFSSPTGTSSASWTTHFTPESSKVNLANSGDQLKVTWIFTPQNVNASNTNQNFRVALVNTPTGGRPLTDASPSSGAYAGYALFMNFGQTTGRATPFQLLERSGSGDLLSAGALWGGAVDAPGFGNGANGYASGAEYTLTMTLTRNGADLDVNATMSGGTINGTGSVSVSTTDSSPNSFIYDTFSIRPSGATTTAEIFDTRLFRVEFTSIPEPASLALCGMGALASLLITRRK